MNERGPFITALEGLLEGGFLTLSTGAPPSDEEVKNAAHLLVHFERQYRLEMPGAAPTLSIPAALWGAEMFYRACQCLSFREIDEVGVIDRLSRPFSGSPDASAHYSVDLTFRLLPDLFHRSKKTSREDPLLNRLREWVDMWPLSSVGIPDAQPRDLAAIRNHDSLRALYADRVIAREDTSRLNEAWVRESVSAAIGIYDGLAPSLAKFLRSSDKTA